MLRIVPSQIVDVVREVISKHIGNDSVVRRELGLAQLATPLALFYELPEEHFALLSPDEYLRLRLVAGEMQQRVILWQGMSEEDARGGRGAKLTRTQVETFADLLARAQDDRVTVPETTLDFIAKSDRDFADALLLDMSTAHSALANGEFKAACVMAGSAAEALLLWATRRFHELNPGELDKSATAAATTTAKFDAGRLLHWGLGELIAVGRKIRSGSPPVELVTEELGKVLALATEYRNLIHPGRVERMQQQSTLGTAHLAVGAMHRAVEHLKVFAVAGGL